ncbi:MAG: GNAT family N-acetyltransferase [Pseudomonadota bacterium]
MQLEAPVLATERLVLRPYQWSDFEAFAAYFASPRSEFTDGPVSRERAWDMFAAGAGNWRLVGYGAWSVERRDDGVHLGLVSLNPPMALPEPELGWILWDGFEGKGYGLEAAQTARDFAFASLGWRGLLSNIHRRNTRSIRLAERMGCTIDPGVLPPDPATDRVYRHPAPDDRYNMSSL